MSKIRTTAAIIACRLTRLLLRAVGKGGTSLPGMVAVKLYKGILSELSKNVNTIIVTGTNGKTTSSRMIEQTLIELKRTYFCNKSGANMLGGIVAEFCENSTLTGKKKYDWALIECDEAAFRTVSKYIDAKCVLVTNIFRDQLDRYGEVTHTLNSIITGIKNSKNAVVCLNADCSLTVSIADQIDNQIIYYGVDKAIYEHTVNEVSDAPYCIKCKSKYDYSYHTFGHLGGFRCSGCGYSRPAPAVSVTDIIETNDSYSLVALNIGGEKFKVKINLPGGYNIYNAVGTACVGYALGFDSKIDALALENFECGFGRMEMLPINEAKLRMILVKNPAGCNQVLNFLCNNKESSLFIVALNDNYADGTDISWIWDVDFEKLTSVEDKLHEIWVTGIRADEMAMRFKYAGISTEKIKVKKDYDSLINDIGSYNGSVYMMPTYTAMLAIRKKIADKFGFKEFWK